MPRLVPPPTSLWFKPPGLRRKLAVKLTCFHHWCEGLADKWYHSCAICGTLMELLNFGM